MKKYLCIICLFCTQASFAQTSKTSPASIETEFPCPAGSCPIVTIAIETFNFHKPRTTCTTGFGLCIKLNAGITCTSCYGKTMLNGNKVNAWARLSSKTAELHIPASLKNAAGFEKTDMTTFQLEDKTVSFTSAQGIVKWVKGGIYPVITQGEEYIITLNLY